jgi:uncharacterized protein YqfA (UPF0365 family)
MNVFEILRMWLIKVPPSKIYKMQAELAEEGLLVGTRDLTNHYLASDGNTNELIELVSAVNQHNLEIDLPFASALVLSGRSEQVVENLKHPNYRQKYLDMWKSKMLT